MVHDESIRIRHVTPLAGVWIEIARDMISVHFCFVTPLAGVWIEIEKNPYGWRVAHSHSPCGSVD